MKHAAQKFVDSLQMGPESVMISVMLFSGPRNWREGDKCRDGITTDLKQCGVRWVTGNSSLPTWSIDKWDVIKRIEALNWPQGGTMTGLALMEAKNELANSRTDAPSTVIVITDGKPSYPSKATEAAESLRDVARLVWVAVGSGVTATDFE